MMNSAEKEENISLLMRFTSTLVGHKNLKQIYDTHVDLKVAFTGSSVLDIIQGEADLSRRAPVYHYRGFLSESIWRCLRALSSQLIV